MARNTQKSQKNARKKQARKAKRTAKLRQRQKAPPTMAQIDQRQRRRIAKQVPQAWDSEIPEDVAVYDDDVLVTLEPGVQQQVRSVREALRLACQSQPDDASQTVAGIPRSSVLSDWRLLVRGLNSWTAADTVEAAESWDRLNPDRRPARIATALVAARRKDVASLDLPSEPPEHFDTATMSLRTDDGVLGRLDDSLLTAAKLANRVCVDRTALRIAKAELARREEDPEILVGPEKVRWIKQFARDFSSTEPKLTTALQHAALQRAYSQPFIDVFTQAARTLSGPVHDRSNSLLSYFYYASVRSTKARGKECLTKYLLTDVPLNERISPGLRQAILSLVYLREANSALEEEGQALFERLSFQDNIVDNRQVEKDFELSIRAMPSHEDAHEQFTDWLTSRLESDQLSETEQARLESNLANGMRRWTKSLPNSIAPRLWLVDYLIENENLEEAQPHVDRLTKARHDDPRILAIPWKWELLTASRHCRRKAWLEQVPAHLQRIEKLWPEWLNSNWLEYLHAAFHLRSGDHTACEQHRTAASRAIEVQRDSLTDACMMLAAAQQMRVPAAELKALRTPVQDAVKSLSKIPDQDLLLCGRFFHDLHRTRLVYPAYRSHGSKIGKEFMKRLNSDRMSTDRLLAMPHISDALLWASEHRFWGDGHTSLFPKTLESAAQKDPIIAAAKINGLLKTNYPLELDRSEVHLDLLRNAGPTMPDADHRFWFAQLVTRAEEALEKFSGNLGLGSLMERFQQMFNTAHTEYDELDDFDDDDDEFEEHGATQKYDRYSQPELF